MVKPEPLHIHADRKIVKTVCLFNFQGILLEIYLYWIQEICIVCPISKPHAKVKRKTKALSFYACKWKIKKKSISMTLTFSLFTDRIQNK